MSFNILNHEKQYRGHAFDVAKVHISLPDGRKRYYDLVEHGNSVTIVPVDPQGRIYFVLQHRIGSNNILLELPAGVLNEGETPLQCAKREIREEIGMAAGEIIQLGSFYLAPGYTDEYMTIFLATGLYEAPLPPDEDEFLTVEVMPAAEAFRKVYAGELHDGKTLAALMLAQPYLEIES
ncbi:MAG: NUDIX hydrolase [Chloroflexota bacterium]|nr:NUDIX hydrolase [Chloroflexota bacterium]